MATAAVDRPNEWPKTWRGYGDRLGARAAERAISQTVVLGLSSVRDGIRGGVTSLLFPELVSTAREFWPRRHR